MPPKTPKETYLNKEFDYSKLTKLELLAILFEHNVKTPPSNAKKDVILQVYKTNIYDKIDELKQTTKADSTGIEFNTKKEFFTPTKEGRTVEGFKVAIKSRNSGFNEPTKEGLSQPIRNSISNQPIRKNYTSDSNQPIKKNSTSDSNQPTRKNYTPDLNQPIRKNSTSDSNQPIRNKTSDLNQPIRNDKSKQDSNQPIKKNSTSDSNQPTRKNSTSDSNQPIKKNSPLRKESIKNQPIKSSQAAISPVITDTLENKGFKSQTPPKRLLEIKKESKQSLTPPKRSFNSNLFQKKEDFGIQPMSLYESDLRDENTIYSSPIKQISTFRNVDLDLSDSTSKSSFVQTNIPSMNYRYLFFLTLFLALLIANLVINHPFYNFYFELLLLFSCIWFTFFYFFRRSSSIERLVNQEANKYYRLVLRKTKESSKKGKGVYVEAMRNKLGLDRRVWKRVLYLMKENGKVQQRKGLVKGSRVDVWEYNF